MFPRLRKQMLNEEPAMGQGQTPASSDDDIGEGSLDPVPATTSDIEDDLKELPSGMLVVPAPRIGE
jgi:hypothetical protein